MTLDTVRERMARFLRDQGLDAVCAWPDAARSRRRGAVAAVSLKTCEDDLSGFWNYLGEWWNPTTNRWEERYGRRVKLTFGLDLYAIKAADAQAAFDTLARALHQKGPEGLHILSLSGGDLAYEDEWKLFRCPAEALCQAFLYAAPSDKEGHFTDFEVRGVRA